MFDNVIWGNAVESLCISQYVDIGTVLLIICPKNCILQLIPYFTLPDSKSWYSICEIIKKSFVPLTQDCLLPSMFTHLWHQLGLVIKLFSSCFSYMQAVNWCSNITQLQKWVAGVNYRWCVLTFFTAATLTWNHRFSWLNELWFSSFSAADTVSWAKDARTALWLSDLRGTEP